MVFVFFLCSFVMNLGKDSTHLGLHFNPRFDAHGDVNLIVCNSKKMEEWGTEQRETVFPFQKGAPIEVQLGIYSPYVLYSELSVQGVAGFSCLVSATIQISEQWQRVEIKCASSV